MRDDAIFSIFSVGTVMVVWTWVIIVLFLRLRRTRPGLDIALPIAVGFALKLIAAVGVSLLPNGRTLRGADELGFLESARELADQGLTSGEALTTLTADLHIWLFAAQL